MESCRCSLVRLGILSTCAPFKSTHERPKMVHISIYRHVYANISPYCTYLTILVPVDEILPINLQDSLFVPPPPHYCGRRRSRSRLIQPINVCTDSDGLHSGLGHDGDHGGITALVKPSRGGQARPKSEPRCSICPSSLRSCGLCVYPDSWAACATGSIPSCMRQGPAAWF